VDQLRSQGKRVRFNNNIPFCLGGSRTQACPAGDTHCTISPAGKVRVCNHSPVEVGDLLTTPIQDIWQGEAIQAWRRQVPTMCRACAAFDSCRGGCRATASANGLSVDPLACGPYRVPPPWPPIHHALPADSYPISDFALHAEAFGYVLINRSHILKMSAAAAPLLDVLQEGTRTLAEIAATFGQPSLNLIGLLYDARMVELRRLGEQGPME
jgi:radical SAM protein with 4Fe4S-binding SPASM domain